jgi:hypothetical protein
MAKSKKAAPGKVKKAVRKRPQAVAAAKAVAKPTAPAVNAPAAAPAAVAGVSAKSSHRGLWWSALIVALIVLMGVEIYAVLKNKIGYQGKVISLFYFGERGEAPDKIGKFWGVNRVRIDNARKRVVMVDGMFNKLLYWDTLKGEHLMDMDKDGPHKLDAQGRPSVKNFTPTNGDLDAEGNMYVLDKNAGLVTVFGPDFKIKNSWKVNPSDKMGVSKEGFVYLLDGRTQDIVKYNATGQELKHFGADTFANPGPMAVDETGNVYVVDLGQKKVFGFSSEGKEILKFSPHIRPMTDLAFEARNGKLYLSVYDSKELFVYTTQGKLLWDINLPYPAVVAVDDDGILYLAGPGGIGAFRIQKQFQ